MNKLQQILKSDIKLEAMHYRILAISALLIILAVLFFIDSRQAKHDAEYRSLVDDQRVLSQRISKNALEASRGEAGGFDRLKELRDEFEQKFNFVKSGNPETGLPESPSAVEAELGVVETSWLGFREQADKILENRDAILSLNESIRAISDSIPNLLAQSDEVVGLMIESGASQQQIYIASRQLMLTQRIAQNVRKVSAGGEGAATAADRFGRDANLFNNVLQGLLKGDPKRQIQPIADEDARAELEEVIEAYQQISVLIDKVFTASPKLFAVHKATAKISANAPQILSALSSLSAKYRTEVADGHITPALIAIVGLITIVLTIFFGLQMLREARIRQKSAEGEAARNQEAIMRLLDEMGNMADGDLTVECTVSEDITGAIADSTNYTIDALRKLVHSINEASVQVSSASQETQATAMHLAEASDHQAQQITDASTAINEMAVSIEGVSSNAEESALVAQNSVDTARRGSEAVQNTMKGMDTIREQIQETSKRIKRLGESSQEIGDIVETVNDIAEQTNILALNAAIQAAMAGEAGRGFAVVADEVQRLAERSSNATKQIEALVKTIQTDTNEAVISMEKSTSDVVAGAKLAEGAGKALEEIENVSQSLADLISNISDSAKQQSVASGNISNTMNVIQEITTQTSAGTNETATSIGNLADLANELRKSVAGFKLPD